MALAAPTGGLSIAGALGLTGLTAAVVGGIGASIFTLGAGLLMTAFQGKPTAPGSLPLNVKQSLNDSTIIIGKCRVGAKLTFFHPRKDGDTHYRYFVWTVAGHRCHSLTKWFLGDDQVTVNPATGEVTSGPYAGNAWLWFERGSYDAVANPTFVAECGGKWTVNHRGRGVAKIYAKFKMAKEVVEAGMPTVTAEIQGSDEIFDPRTETTGYTSNAILAFYWWMALPRAEGGFGCYEDEIDWDWVSAQANVCDEDVALKAGGTEKRYALDGFLTTGSDPSAVRDVLVTNMAGRFTYSGGLMLARPGYWVPVSATVSEDDLTEAISYDLLAAGDQRVTEVVATWNDPANLYQPDELPAQAIASDNEAQASLDLPFVKSRARCQRIQKIKLYQGQAEQTLTWPVNIMGLGVAPMDTIQLGTSRYNLDNYAFTVASWSLSQSFDIVLQVREENPEMYEWSASEEVGATTSGKIDKADPVPDPDVVGLQITVGGQSETITAHQSEIVALKTRLDNAGIPDA